MTVGDFTETNLALLNIFKVMVTYANISIAHQKGELSDDNVKVFKKHFDPIAIKVADRLGEVYRKQEKLSRELAK